MTAALPSTQSPARPTTPRHVADAYVAAACELEATALAALAERNPERVIATNVEFWAAVLLDFAEVPSSMFTPMFSCARSAGWSAHILEQKKTGRLIRPSARYTGEAPRGLESVTGHHP